MENIIKKWLRRIAISSSISLLCLLLCAGMVLAIPDDISVVTATATNNTVSLTWTKAVSSTSTVIRYSTVTYPATPADGSLAYSGTASFMTLNSLTPGQIYYFSLWGYDGVSYSVNKAIKAISTIALVADNTTIPYNQPTIPTQAYQNPSTANWSWYPLNLIVAYFSDNTSSHGGLGMQSENVTMLIAGVMVSFVGLFTYVKWHNFFGAWFIVTIMCSFACIIGVMQWIVIGLLLLVAVGVWAVEHNFQ